jgi:uncharacterized protein (DUF1330 family)
MSAYVIGHITVKDPGKWAEYRSQVPATLATAGGEVAWRGRKANVLCGAFLHADVVVLRFPDVDTVEKWYNSAAYQALIPLREEAAEMVLITYEA